MRKLVTFLAALAATTTANAGVVFFTNQATWQAAAGPATVTEDFSGFAADTQFRTAVVPLNGMTITQQGVDAGFRNFVDVSPFLFPDNNGTSHASLFTNADAPGTFVRVNFNAPASAFGFQTWEGNDFEGATLEVYSGATLLGSFDLANDPGAFLGFVTTAGDTATSVRFRSRTLIAGSGGEGFGLDNLSLVTASTTVPEPVSLLVFGGLLAGGAGVALRRRMTKAAA